MKQRATATATATGGIPESYLKYTGKKTLVVLSLVILIVLFGIIAICAGSADLTPWQVVTTLLGKGSESSEIIIWKIRLPRLAAAIVAGAGLAMAGCVMQNILRNPLADSFTLGIAQGAAFGAAFAIVVLGAGGIQTSSTDAGFQPMDIIEIGSIIALSWPVPELPPGLVWGKFI